MILEGDLSVLDAIKEKKRLMDSGVEHGHIKPLLIIDGGLMKGAYGAGAVVALEELRLTNIFTNVVGVSSGAPTAAYFVAGEANKGVSIYYEECTTREFLNMWRFWHQVNTRYLVDVFKGKTGKGVSTKKIFSSPVNVHFGVADFDSGEPKLLRPETDENLFKAIQASILMPNVSTDVVTFDDIRYVDGGFTRPHILRKAIDEIEATHVLVITNQDKIFSALPRLERFLNHTLFRMRMPKPLRFAAHERRKERLKAIEYMENEYHVPYALVWGDHSISSMERSSEKVKAVVERSRQWWHDLFKG